MGWSCGWGDKECLQNFGEETSWKTCILNVEEMEVLRLVDANRPITHEHVRELESRRAVSSDAAVCVRLVYPSEMPETRDGPNISERVRTCSPKLSSLFFLKAFYCTRSIVKRTSH
jgi:hypothetical protein